MITRSEMGQTNSVANPSKRSRLESLLFNGATPAKAFVGPKLPPFQGE